MIKVVILDRWVVYVIINVDLVLELLEIFIGYIWLVKINVLVMVKML